MSTQPTGSSDDFVISRGQLFNQRSNTDSYVEELLRQKQSELKDQLSKLEEQVKSVRAGGSQALESNLVKDTLEWKIAKIDELINFRRNSNTTGGDSSANSVTSI